MEVEMYVDDPAMTDIRPTVDIDCVTQLESRISFWDFEEKQRKKASNACGIHEAYAGAFAQQHELDEEQHWDYHSFHDIDEPVV